MSKQTIDVSQLNGWSDLSEGTQAVTVKTIVNGVEDSASSNVVTLEKILTKQEKEVSLLMVDGDQVILPDADKTMSKAIVKKPSTLIPSNIRQGVSIGGVVGEMTGTSKEEEIVTVDLAMLNGNQEVVPSRGKTLSKVIVSKPDTMLPENIKKNIEIGGVIGVLESTKEEQEKTINITENGTTEIIPDNGKVLSKVTAIVNVPSSGGTELNIAYGDTPPTDTSKLWIKSAEPANIEFPVVWKTEQIINGFVNKGELISSKSLCQATVIGSNIYVLEELKDGSITYKQNLYKYDVAQNVMTKLTTINYRDFGVCMVAAGTNIYFFGGAYADNPRKAYSYNTISKYNILTGEKTTLSTTLPATRDKMQGAVVGSLIYLFGGEQGEGKTNGTYSSASTIYKFDTDTETITTVRTASYGYMGAGIAVVGTVIYLLGGYTNYRDSSSNSTNSIYKFDTSTEEITLLTTKLPIELNNLGCTAIGSNIYIFGGYHKTSSESAINDTVYKYDTQTQGIIELENTLPQQNYGEGCTAFGNNIFIFNGYSSYSVLKFTIEIPLTTGDIVVDQGSSQKKFSVIKTPLVEVRVKNVYRGDNNLAEFVDAYLHNGIGWVNVNTLDLIQTNYNPPTISLSDNILTITSSETGVTGYKIYDGSTLLTTAILTVDLSTLITTSGTHIITVKAVGTSYGDSPASNAVTYTLQGLTTPAISLVSGTTIQIDTIDENATTIEVFSDGVSIGEVQKQ